MGKSFFGCRHPIQLKRMRATKVRTSQLPSNTKHCITTFYQRAASSFQFHSNFESENKESAFRAWSRCPAFVSRPTFLGRPLTSTSCQPSCWPPSPRLSESRSATAWSPSSPTFIWYELIFVTFARRVVCQAITCWPHYPSWYYVSNYNPAEPIFFFVTVPWPLPFSTFWPLEPTLVQFDLTLKRLNSVFDIPLFRKDYSPAELP